MPGISLSRTAIGLGGSSQSWSSYWTPPTALTVTVISDYRNRLGWTGGKATSIERSTNGINFAQIATTAIGIVTYDDKTVLPNTRYYYRVREYKGTNYSDYSNVVDIWANIADGDTVAWFPGNDYTNITKDASYLIASQADLLGSGRSLAQSTDANKPVQSTDGVVYDGNDKLTVSAFGYQQPEYIYLVMKILALPTGTFSNSFIDGVDSTHRGLLARDNTVSATNFFVRAGSNVDTGLAPSLGDLKIYRLIFNGATSKLKIGDVVSVDMNAGTQGMNGIIEGGNYAGATFANIQRIESIYRSTADNEAAIYAYLQAKYLTGKVHNIVWEGHSMINPLEVGTDIAVPDHAKKYLDINHNIQILPSTNIAIGGSTVANCSTRKAAKLTPLKSATTGIKNIVVLWIGTNDVTSTVGSGTTAYNALKTYVDGLISDGWTVVIITMTKANTNAQRLIERTAFNNAIKANTSYQYIVDVDLIPELADPTDTTYFATVANYDVDTVHLINAGNTLVAQALAAKIATIP